MKKYVCTVCHYEYDPEIGDPDNGVAPGTDFADADLHGCPLWLSAAELLRRTGLLQAGG